MKQKTVGIYPLGNYDVQIVLREGTGGEFWLTPEKGLCPRIKVGASYKGWADFLSVLVHEGMELSLELLSCRYSRPGSVARDDGDYLFVLTHVQFSEACAMTAMLLSECIPDVVKHWRKWRRT